MIRRMTGSALSLRGVTHRFRDAQVLVSVDLDVGEGEIYGFLGLNGAGKTTTIRILVGLLRLQAGDVRIYGADVRSAPSEVYRNVGVLFEDFAAHPYLTGREQALLHARFLGVPAAEARSSADRWLERVGLAAKASARVKGYSLGMRRRLGLACALVASPRVVILDEPTNGLDPQGIADLRGHLQSLNLNEGVTIFLSSHILGEVEQLCTRVGILHGGRIRLEGAVKELTGRGTPRHRVRAVPLAKAREVLEAQGGGGSVAVDGAGDALLAELKPEDVPRRVRELVAAGVEVYEVSPRIESLENVFHEVVDRAESSISEPVGTERAS